MDKIVIICGLLSGVFMMRAVFLMANILPDKNILLGFKGRSTWGHAKINGISCTVTFIINKDKLAIKCHFPNIGLLLDLESLNISELRSFIGHRIKVVSSDKYVNHMFKELIISKLVARKLKKLSDGGFAYDRV